MPEAPFSFAEALAHRITERREALTREWVEILSERLPVERRDVLPSASLLNHIPAIIARVAEFVADGEAALLESLVLDDLGRLTELRLKQGFGIQELLREYRVLASLLQRECEDEAREYRGAVDPVDLVTSVGRMKDATQLLSAVTARSFRLWEGRYSKEGRDQIESYGRVLSHELGNRLGAAETALLLLLSDMEIPPEKRRHLSTLALESLRRAQQTIDDVETLAQPLSTTSSEATIGLPLLVKEALQMAQVSAVKTGIAVKRLGDVPDVRVPGPPLRVALSNLLANALKYHREGPPDRWVRLATQIVGDDVDIIVEDNGPGIAEEDRERVFHQWYRGDVDEDGSGLGLAITRDAIERVGGTVEVSEGADGGARFVVRLKWSSPVDRSRPERVPDP